MRAANSFRHVKSDGHTTQDSFSNVVSVFQAILIVLFAVFTTYGEDCNIVAEKDGQTTNPPNMYAMYQDVHVMMFIGFGFLMTFLKKYGLSSVSFNFLLTVVCIQWNVLTSGTKGFWHYVWSGTWDHKIGLDMVLLIESDFAAACCLISMGAVLGKTNALQLVVMAVMELVFFNCNLMLCLDWLGVADQGGSIVVHTFGAFFGLAVSYISSPPAAADHPDNSASRSSDTFAMIGTLFLFMFWPSFNGALATGEMQSLVVINTTLALCGSAVATFVFSARLRKVGLFDMVDIQNATLAGGVAVGAVSNLLIAPGGALGLGFAAGAFCVFGYVHIAPFLERTIGLQDTCGVQNLHGYSGILGAIASAAALAAATEERYGATAHAAYFGDDGALAHSTPTSAAAHQLAALGLTLLFAIGSGLLTGVVVKQLASRGSLPADALLFDDAASFAVEEDEGADGSTKNTVVYTRPADDAPLPYKGVAASLS